MAVLCCNVHWLKASVDRVHVGAGRDERRRRRRRRFGRRPRAAAWRRMRRARRRARRRPAEAQHTRRSHSARRQTAAAPAGLQSDLPAGAPAAVRALRLPAGLNAPWVCALELSWRFDHGAARLSLCAAPSRSPSCWYGYQSPSHHAAWRARTPARDPDRIQARSVCVRSLVALPGQCLRAQERDMSHCLLQMEGGGPRNRGERAAGGQAASEAAHARRSSANGRPEITRPLQAIHQPLRTGMTRFITQVISIILFSNGGQYKSNPAY